MAPLVLEVTLGDDSDGKTHIVSAPDMYGDRYYVLDDEHEYIDDEVTNVRPGLVVEALDVSSVHSFGRAAQTTYTTRPELVESARRTLSIYADERRKPLGVIDELVSEADGDVDRIREALHNAIREGKIAVND